MSELNRLNDLIERNSNIINEYTEKLKKENDLNMRFYFQQQIKIFNESLDRLNKKRDDELYNIEQNMLRKYE